jgi:hypothetical protein
MNPDRIQSWRAVIRRNFYLKAVIPQRMPIPLEHRILQCLVMRAELVPR